MGGTVRYLRRRARGTVNEEALERAWAHVTEERLRDWAVALVGVPSPTGGGGGARGVGRGAGSSPRVSRPGRSRSTRCSRTPSGGCAVTGTGPDPAPVRPDRHLHHRQRRRGCARRRPRAAPRHASGAESRRTVRLRSRRREPEGACGPAWRPRSRRSPQPASARCAGDLFAGLRRRRHADEPAWTCPAPASTRGRATAARSCWSRASSPTRR